ncbi:ATP-binding protein [Bifidobacterium aerophilum]|uniref:GHKL domain-containing protein n=1 Tax=Bifidobacterium aerophilum TaxID=1798155 RepID=A0A6N9Z5A0_9BIFI|nr:ATP-binding protein [Bifidobacterium aerophilum]NEG89778.1 GHKL domain-containing protein [Bifidobacterium aerophilum]
MLPVIGNLITSDPPKLWVVLAEWLACMVIVLAYPKRRAVWLRCVVAVASFALIAGIQYGLLLQQQGGITAVWFLLMLLSVVAMGTSVALCCEMGVALAVFSTLRALSMAEFAGSLAWQLTFFATDGDEPGVDMAVAAGMLVVCYGLLFPAFFLMERKLGERLDYATFDVTWGEVAVSVGISLFAFVLSNARLVSTSNPFSGTTTSEVFNVRTLAAAGGLICLYAYLFQLAEAHTRKRLDAVNQVLVAQYAQYQQSKENIDIINRKYHDLKQQLDVLRAETDEGKRNGYLDGIEESLKEYGARVVTGNGVLDTVLTSKSSLCAHLDIAMTCVADGSLVDGIDAMDLCTIVGNALDNAIEAEERIAERDRRLINVSLSRLNAFAVFKVANYAPERPELHDGLPVTTKSDRTNHGFGMASMRHCARKYGGDMTVGWRDGWFELQVLIPLAS